MGVMVWTAAREPVALTPQLLTPATSAGVGLDTLVMMWLMGLLRVKVLGMGG